MLEKDLNKKSKSRVKTTLQERAEQYYEIPKWVGFQTMIIWNPFGKSRVETMAA